MCFYSDLLEYYEKRLKMYYRKSERFSFKQPRSCVDNTRSV